MTLKQAKPDLNLTETELWNVLECISVEMNQVMEQPSKTEEMPEYFDELQKLGNRIARHLGIEPNSGVWDYDQKG